MSANHELEGTEPRHRISQLATLVNGHPFDSADFSSDAEVPLVRIRDLTTPTFETFVPREKVPRFALVRDGDVLIGMDGDFNSVLWNRGEAALNQRVCLLRPHRGVDSRYLAYALPTHLKEINDLTWSTTVKHLAAGSVRAIRVPAHSADHQRAIADYLDRETAQIDAFIAKNEELIALLTERRTVAINGMVWSGLGDDATPAAVGEALPQAPQHWLRVRNKQLFRERAGLSEDGGGELLTVSHITGVTPRSEKNVTMFEAESTVGYKLVHSGDLVINTMWAWMGALGVASAPGIASPAYGVYRRIGDLPYEPRYFDYIYRSAPYVAKMSVFSRGITDSRLRLYPEAFLRLPVVVPPLEEQRAIADRIADQTAGIDKAVSSATRGIGLARERRAALISAAVTGKIDIAPCV
ncbi:restriction endonuclease subunit S [Microbacterium sp. HA-8]|uniref:restriction endonuclease subunit S n=1 Tax=Microbacterium sp. HA-8 TaxID=3234200 RepID=UPI0038F61B49